MPYRLKFRLMGLLVIGATLFALQLSAAEVPTVRIGVVIDGPWKRDIEIFEIFQREIFDITKGEFDVRFPPDKTIRGNWTIARVKSALQELLADPEVDLILALGVLSSHVLCCWGELSKPAIAPFIIDSKIQGLPMKAGASGVKNLSYVASVPPIATDLKIFREIVPYTRITILYSRLFYKAIPKLLEGLQEEVKKIGADPAFVPVDTSIEEALILIPADTQAVYVTPLFRLPVNDFDLLVTGLIKRKLPSFSLFGKNEVEQGILAGVALESDFPRLARRVALNVQSILLGKDAGTFPVTFRRDEQLIINMATARSIGFYPSWSILSEAALLNQEDTAIDRRLSLYSVVKEAIAANLDLAAKDRAVAAGVQHVHEAKSVLYPQLGITGHGVVIDKDRAEAAFGLQRERTFSGSANLTQIIYSEPARANIKVQNYLQTSSEEEREQLRLDIVLEAAVAYLNVLRAKTFERIRQDNLKLTRSNLKLALVRQSIGFSGPAEVYRWESRLATDRKILIEADAQHRLAEMALNRLLHRPLNEKFIIEDVGIDDPELITSRKRLFSYIDNPWTSKIFSDFLVLEGFSISPELRRLKAAMAAQERIVVSARRSFWSPSIGLKAEVAHILAEGGAGDKLDGSSQLFSLFSQPDDTDWSIGLNISLPLFTGGERSAILRRSLEESSRLRLEHKAAKERIEQRIRSTLQVANVSYAGIQLADDAAKAAHKNLNLVTESYSRGVVSIIELLDAQNAALVADQTAANAVYDFLIDLMEVQRAVGMVDFFMTEEDRKAWFERLDAFFAGAGAP